ncbi:ATP-binding cassette domain-containing protein [Natroniella acetigena]|uniref:ATP-binding cassette domain-containing protein n=1 Tax=Natroniella acetigena TaxID=52004 RepID=UPI00200AA795|nr:ATP-binding cassette domain-containing protein [Natroniella acetigena]MCK8827224.1 ATP-binding cassette domain-containing protein [Natroniella acetigena]
MQNIIRVENLTKKYEELIAVNDISFSVEKGDIFGFLGPNGAGKTTTVRMLTGVFPSDNGEIYLAGYNLKDNPFQAKQKIGVVPELANAYLDLTALENILFMANLYGLLGSKVEKKAEELLNTFNLEDRMNDKVKKFSKGMQQRVIICMALINDPEIIFLDEPTSGLDVESRRLIKNIILELNDKGKTIFLTTHNINEANSLCNKIAIINKGKIAAINTPENLKRTIKSSQSIRVSFDKDIAFKFKDWDVVNKVKKEGDKYRIYTDTPDELIFKLTNLARNHKTKIRSINTLDPSLEDVFIKLTGGDKT